MTNKINIQFNEIEKIHLDSIKKLIEKPYDKLSQEDLIEARNLTDRYRDCHYEPNQQYQLIDRLMNMQLDSRLYRPMDQRSFIEYVTDIVYDWVHDNLDYGTSTFNAFDPFDCYYADGTITYNTQQTLNYIRTFWDDFHEDDLNDIEAKFVFERPETFFVQQCHYMAERLLNAIFDSQEKYNKKDFLDYVDNKFDIYKLTELIY